MADYLAVDNRLRSSSKQEVLVAAIKLMDELKKEREQGVINERPTIMELSFAHQVREKDRKISSCAPPLPPQIQQERTEEFSREYYKLNPDKQHFDPYRDIQELPMGGRKTGD
ncbi:hypothetical protein RHA65_11515 [Providencia rettgeri]|uniref:hypothetical protein n=1 Tax=Providencia rettgeri TaxID=587 RepID=UPI001B382355|nr:hypothetical protein [Providencia rettgeri]MBQ0210185.1 hypothetical protein [Providencia rettgeri]MDR9615255.1 hypothetical protein [Providencia rettgeri]